MGTGPQRWDRDTEMGKKHLGTATEMGQSTGTGAGLTGLPIATGPPALLVGAGPGVGIVSHRFHQPVHDFIRSIVWGAGNVLLGWRALGWGGVPCPCMGTTGMPASAVVSQLGMPSVPLPPRSYPGWPGCGGQGHPRGKSAGFSCSHDPLPSVPQGRWTPQQVVKQSQRCQRTSRSAAGGETGVGDLGEHHLVVAAG